MMLLKKVYSQILLSIFIYEIGTIKFIPKINYSKTWIMLS